MLHAVNICTVFFVFKIILSYVLNSLKGNVHITVAAILHNRKILSFSVCLAASRSQKVS